VINVGNDEEVSIGDLADRIAAKCGGRSPVRRLEYGQAFPGGGFEDMRRRVPSLARIKALTGWAPARPLDAILDDVIADRRRRLRLPAPGGA
jgi:UDP-glucose 4-epimerase